MTRSLSAELAVELFGIHLVNAPTNTTFIYRGVGCAFADDYDNAAVLIEPKFLLDFWLLGSSKHDCQARYSTFSCDHWWRAVGQ